MADVKLGVKAGLLRSRCVHARALLIAFTSSRADPSRPDSRGSRLRLVARALVRAVPRTRRACGPVVMCTGSTHEEDVRQAAVNALKKIKPNEDSHD